MARHYYSTAKSARFEDAGNGWQRLYSDYDAAFVLALKSAVPAGSRKPVYAVPGGKFDHWRISSNYYSVTVNLLRDAGYDIYPFTTTATPYRPAPPDPVAQPTRLNLRLNYLGNLRRRASGEVWATGADESGEWCYRFPLDVLERWFGFALSRPNPAEALTYYAALGIEDDATADEVKRAFRAGIKVWHPDISGDDGRAARALHEAKTVLTDPKLRKRYDAGRKLADTGVAPGAINEIVWTIPARWRCGYLVATVEEIGGLWLVSEIHEWKDIVRDDQRMISWWDGDIQYDWVAI